MLAAILTKIGLLACFASGADTGAAAPDTWADTYSVLPAVCADAYILGVADTAPHIVEDESTAAYSAYDGALSAYTDVTWLLSE